MYGESRSSSSSSGCSNSSQSDRHATRTTRGEVKTCSSSSSSTNTISKQSDKGPRLLFFLSYNCNFHFMRVAVATRCCFFFLFIFISLCSRFFSALFSSEAAREKTQRAIWRSRVNCMDITGNKKEEIKTNEGFLQFARVFAITENDEREAKYEWKKGSKRLRGLHKY